MASQLSTFQWQENRCRLLRSASGFTYSSQEGSSDLCQAVQRGPCIQPFKPKHYWRRGGFSAPISGNKCRPTRTVSVLSAPLSPQMTAVAINPYLFLSCGAGVEDVMDSQWHWFLLLLSAQHASFQDQWPRGFKINKFSNAPSYFFGLTITCHLALSNAYAADENLIENILHLLFAVWLHVHSFHSFLWSTCSLVYTKCKLTQLICKSK